MKLRRSPRDRFHFKGSDVVNSRPSCADSAGTDSGSPRRSKSVLASESAVTLSSSAESGYKPIISNKYLIAAESTSAARTLRRNSTSPFSSASPGNCDMRLPAFFPWRSSDSVISRDQYYSSEILRVKVNRLPLLLLALDVRYPLLRRQAIIFFCGKTPFLLGPPV